MSWRTGKKVPINVYDNDRPVCQCQTAMDAKLIVRAVNKLLDEDVVVDAEWPEVEREPGQGE
jgi:hypothetical protein